MKGESAELLFKLKGARTLASDERMNAEAPRAAAFIVHSPAFGIAEAVASLAFDLADVRSAVAGAMGGSLSLARDALAHSFGTFAIAAEVIRARGEEMRAAVSAAGHLGSAFSGGYGFAAARAVALPEPPPPLCIHVHIIHAEEGARAFTREGPPPDWSN